MQKVGSMPVVTAPRFTRMPAILGGLIAAVLVLTTSGGVAAFAEELPTASIAGNIQDRWGNTVWGASVELFGEDESESLDVVSANDGTFRFENLAAGDYRVRASANGYVTEWWQDASSFGDATLIPVVDVEVTDIVFELAVPVYTLTGTVTAGDTLDPLPGVGVEVLGEYGDYSEVVLTDENGRYEVTDLPEQGSVHFVGTGNYAGEWFDNVPDSESAVKLSFDSDHTVDAVLSTAGTISGTVTGALKPGGKPQPVAEVSAILYSTKGAYITETSTDDTGKYSFTGVAPGSYRLGFFGVWTDWNATYYGGVDRLSLSPIVTMSEGRGLDSIDAKLVPLSVLSGTVFNGATGDPIDTAHLVLRTLNGAFVDETWTSRGNYVFRDVPSGSYAVQVWDSGEEAGTWYGGGESVASATPIVIKRGVSTLGKNITLVPAGGLSGTVSSSVALDGTQAVLVNSKGEDVITRYVYRGEYEFSGVKPGKYVLKFVPRTGRAVGEWWSNKRTRQTATPVTITAGKTTELGKVVLATVLPGKIIGHVAGGAGSTVRFSGPGADDGNVFEVPVDDSGNYVIDNLAPGAFTLTFADGQYYKDRFGEAVPIPLVVNAGKTTVASTVTLRERVPVNVRTFAGDAPISAMVEFFTTRGVLVDTAYPADDGSTQIELPRAQYKVRFSGMTDSDRGTVWLGGKADLSSSLVLDLRTGDPASVTGNLPRASTFSAKIVDAAKGRPLSEISVWTYELRPDGVYQRVGNEVSSDVAGRFSIPRLGSGTYKFQLVDVFGTYQTTWYGGTSQSAATAVRVALAPADRVGSTVARLAPTTGKVAVQTPTISGTMKVGKKLTAKTASVWPAKSVAKTYSWYRNGAPIPRATAATYTLTKSDSGKDITVRVTGSRTGFLRSSTLSLPRTAG